MTLPDSHPAGQLMLQAACEDGWDVANTGEAEVARQLGLLGYTPGDIETQFRLGPYRLDFAIPAERIDIESDGWVHGTSQVRRRDRRRDRDIRGWGWTVIRIDLEARDIAGQLRRHVPPRNRIRDYGDTLRQVDCIFEAYLDRLQRHGVVDPGAHLAHLRDALYSAYAAAGKAEVADATT